MDDQWTVTEAHELGDGKYAKVLTRRLLYRGRQMLVGHFQPEYPNFYGDNWHLIPMMCEALNSHEPLQRYEPVTGDVLAKASLS